MPYLRTYQLDEIQASVSNHAHNLNTLTQDVAAIERHLRFQMQVGGPHIQNEQIQERLAFIADKIQHVSGMLASWPWRFGPLFWQSEKNGTDFMAVEEKDSGEGDRPSIKQPATGWPAWAGAPFEVWYNHQRPGMDRLKVADTGQGLGHLFWVGDIIRVSGTGTKVDGVWRIHDHDGDTLFRKIVLDGIIPDAAVETQYATGGMRIQVLRRDFPDINEQYH